MKLNKILLIDDNLPTNYANKYILDKFELGREVVMFSSGREGYEYIFNSLKLNASVPDLIFLDINMPDIDGWTFMDEIEKLSEIYEFESKILVLTTSSSPVDKELFKEYK